MAIKKEIYQALQDIVGAENISDDPVILYGWAWRSGQAPAAQDFNTLYEAIVMPKDTAEVQAIVRLCNKYRIQYKASSTGWGVYCDPTGPGCIKLDLRRMNSIIEINEKSMYAVVEPYVISAQLQAELMKRGFNCNINGAGSITSAMPLAAHEGIGHMSNSCSYGERNLLAVEWVTPQGDLVKLGSLGTTGEWFCGDGPGPSIRGVIRGNVVPLGGLGVFTKAALKLYHWPGPNTFPVEGTSPNYVVKQLPPNFLARFLHFADEKGRGDAIKRIGESEIGMVIMGFNAEMVASNIGTSNEEDVKLTREFLKEVKGPGFALVIAGNSARDFDYKKRVLEIILKEVGGKSLKYVEDPAVQASFAWRCIRVTSSIRETCRASGAFGGEVFGTDAYNVEENFIQHSLKDKAELIKKGLILNDSLIPFITSIEHGQFAHSEVLIRYTPNPETWAGLMEYVGKSNKNAVEGHFGVPHHVWGDPQQDYFGPNVSNYHIWLRRIKKSFDPNAASESSNYISVKDPQ
jgi:glycolate oxidase